MAIKAISDNLDIVRKERAAMAAVSDGSNRVAERAARGLRYIVLRTQSTSLAHPPHACCACYIMLKCIHMFIYMHHLFTCMFGSH